MVRRSLSCRIVLAFVFGLLLISIDRTQAQSISGVVNSYAHIVQLDSCSNSATVNSTAGFSVGDRVLLIQMTGATAIFSNSAAFGSPIDLNGIGTAEYNTVESIPDRFTLRFTNSLLHSYNSIRSNAQVVRVPVYDSATVVGLLTAAPWDASTGTGGILAIQCTTSLTLQASIDVSGDGFDGGQASQDGGDTIFTDYYCSLTSTDGGAKGGGVAASFPSQFAAGRGALLNGGGGGNADNSGGGGGALRSAGGRGGDVTNSLFARTAVGGEGGYAISRGQLLLGGGGGGGHQNDGNGTAGGKGGGIILIKATKLVDNGNPIVADGKGASTAAGDGAGGGGAGGAILLDINSINSGAKISAAGGNGGNVNCGGQYAYGPGGGGAGGLIATLPSANYTGGNISGGLAGLLQNCTDATLNNTSYGAQPGQPGVREALENTSESKAQYILPSITGSTDSLCSGESVTLGISSGDSVHWNSAQSSSPQLSLSPLGDTTIYATLYRGTCTFTDSVRLYVRPIFDASILGDSVSCLAQPATYFAAPSQKAKYSWSVTNGTITLDHDSTIEVTWSNTGTHTITLSLASDACSATKSRDIVVVTQIQPSIIGSHELCDGESAVLTSSGVYSRYLWSTGDTTASIIIHSPATYGLTVSSQGGCTGVSADFKVTSLPAPTAHIIASPAELLPGGSVSLSVDSDAVYKWSTGAISRTIDISTPGTYSVAVTNGSGCTSYDTVTISLRTNLGSVTLSIPAIHGAPGDHVMLPIQITQSKNLTQGLNKAFYASLRFNGSLLSPIGMVQSSAFQGHERRVSVAGVMSDTMGTLMRIEFVIGLGDSLGTNIYCDSLTWSTGEPIVTVPVSGFFTLDGVCMQGEPRLFSENGKTLLRIMPASTNEVQIDYDLAEAGHYTIRLFDELGRLVNDVIHGDLKAGSYHATLNTSRLSDGWYYCMLKTETQSALSRFHK